MSLCTFIDPRTKGTVYAEVPDEAEAEALVMLYDQVAEDAKHWQALWYGLPDFNGRKSWMYIWEDIARALNHYANCDDGARRDRATGMMGKTYYKQLAAAIQKFASLEFGTG